MVYDNGPVSMDLFSTQQNQDSDHLKFVWDIKVDGTLHIKIIWEKIYYSQEGLTDTPRQELAGLGWLGQIKGCRLGFYSGDEMGLGKSSLVWEM